MMNKLKHRKTFQRLVLLPEDMYRNALSCMAKEAIEKATEETKWYEKDSLSGKVEKTSVPAEDRAKADSVSTDPISISSTATAAAPVSTVNVFADEPENDTVSDSGRYQEVEKPVVVTQDATVQYKPLSSNRKGIPATFRKKYDLLLAKLKLTNRLHVDSQNQLILPSGQVIAGSNFHDLLRFVFTNNTSSARPIGFDSFVLHLRNEGILPSEVTSNVTKKALQAQASQNGQGNVVHKRNVFPPGKRAKILRVY